MTQQELDGLLERFNGKPGVSGGLSHDETIAMFQALIDNKQIYNDPELCEWASVYSDAGWVTGYNNKPPTDSNNKPTTDSKPPPQKFYETSLFFAEMTFVVVCLYVLIVLWMKP